MLPGLRALLDDFCRDPHGAGGDLAEGGGGHVCEGRREGRRVRGEEGLGGLVGAEEEGGAGRGADDGAADAAVDTGEAAGGEEAGGGLQARFEGVEGEEGEVDGGSG